MAPKKTLSLALLFSFLVCSIGIGQDAPDADSVEQILLRAEKVAKALVSIGIPEEAISVSSHGEGNPLVPTEDEVPEPKNRRVEVFVR